MVQLRSPGPAATLFSSLLIPPTAGLKDIVRLLIDAGCDVNSQNSYKATPLLGAADNGHASCVELLLQGGAHLDACSERGDTALHMAAFRGNLDILRQLSHAGSNPFLRNSASLTALQEARANQHSDCAAHLRHYMKQNRSKEFISLPSAHSETCVVPSSLERQFGSWPCETTSYNLASISPPEPVAFSSNMLAFSSYPTTTTMHSFDSSFNNPNPSVADTAPPLPPRRSAQASQTRAYDAGRQSWEHEEKQETGSGSSLTSMLSTVPVKWGRPSNDFDNQHNNFSVASEHGSENCKFKPNIPVEIDFVDEQETLKIPPNNRTGTRVPSEQSSLVPLLPQTQKTFALVNVTSNPKPDFKKTVPTKPSSSNTIQAKQQLRIPRILQSGTDFGNTVTSQINEQDFILKDCDVFQWVQTSSDYTNTLLADQVALIDCGTQPHHLNLTAVPSNSPSGYTRGQDSSDSFVPLEQTLLLTREQLRHTERELLNTQLRLGDAEASKLRLQQDLQVSQTETSILKSEVVKLRSLIQSLTRNSGQLGEDFQAVLSPTQTLGHSGAVTSCLTLTHASSDSQFVARGQDSS
ncbi:GA-binding protein subunit beta-2 isoform X2 [Aplysia californica]|uniref:GA-binding protein subunit beta-2 isoform X2 n=1 Tax=Aplysia californica TaxID=6500 RepID=A0ABM0K5Z1_APLCA|nr:GA-binding protein subunit beta-2 isoform X2 [Aplysia californica]